jgi:hypothetical protein
MPPLVLFPQMQQQQQQLSTAPGSMLQLMPSAAFSLPLPAAASAATAAATAAISYSSRLADINRQLDEHDAVAAAKMSQSTTASCTNVQVCAPLDVQQSAVGRRAPAVAAVAPAPLIRLSLDRRVGSNSSSSNVGNGNNGRSSSRNNASSYSEDITGGASILHALRQVQPQLRHHTRMRTDSRVLCCCLSDQRITST